MRNYSSHQPSSGDDSSWEVQGFVEDASTWPPRSYSCSFCHMEFRSAQALGGHMNVHRHDRAQLRQSAQGVEPPPNAAANSNRIIFSSTDFVASGDMFFYSVVDPIGKPITVDTLSTLLSISPHQAAVKFPEASHLLDKIGMVRDFDENDNRSDNSTNGTVIEELDLELRLGW